MFKRKTLKHENKHNIAHDVEGQYITKADTLTVKRIYRQFVIYRKWKKSALEVIAEIAVAIEYLCAAETATGFFFLDILRQNVSEFAAVLDVFDLKHGACLILGMNFDSAKAEELLTERALYADILHSVEKDLVLIGIKEALFVDEFLCSDSVCGKRPGECEEFTSFALLDKYRILLNLFL